MSTFEQKIEQRDDRVQYLLFAAEPYETVGFKIPNEKIDRSPEKFFTHWDEATNMFYLQLHFAVDPAKATPAAAAAKGAPGGAAMEDEGEEGYEIAEGDETA